MCNPLIVFFISEGEERRVSTAEIEKGRGDRKNFSFLAIVALSPTSLRLCTSSALTSGGEHLYVLKDFVLRITATEGGGKHCANAETYACESITVFESHMEETFLFLIQHCRREEGPLLVSVFS